LTAVLLDVTIIIIGFIWEQYFEVSTFDYQIMDIFIKPESW
jgi:hypothetical protein